MSLAPGDVVDGKYAIEKLLGQGGMGAVYVAFEQHLGRRVAMKVLLPEAAAHPEAVARFEREGRAAAALESDHVTRIFAVGRLENGSPYIVMELLDGHDLAETLQQRGPLPAHEVIRVVVDACDALAEAHSRGIVHRDLKPANLFFARRANGSVTVKVLDFGISKATGATAPAQGLTGTTAMMGTPYYMSPEQIREARDVDARTDIWALGVTMYELLTGVLPFQAASLADLCVAILLTPHAAVSSRRSDVSQALDGIINRCLAKDAGGRFASATELAAALRALGAPALTQNDPSFRAPTQHQPPITGPRLHQTPVAPTAAMTVDPVSNTQNGAAESFAVPKTPVAAMVVAAVVALGGLGALGMLAASKLSGRSAAAADAGPVAPAAAPARNANDAVDAGPAASTLAPLPPPLASAPASSGRPSAKVESPGKPSAKTPPAAPAPQAAPLFVPVPVPVPVHVPAAPQKPVTVPAGPPPIPDGRR